MLNDSHQQNPTICMSQVDMAASDRGGGEKLLGHIIEIGQQAADLRKKIATPRIFASRNHQRFCSLQTSIVSLVAVEW